MEGSVPHASSCRGALIWRGLCPWGKSAIARQRRILSQSNRLFFERCLAARAALSASSARYCPSGPVWRAISRHTTEGLRPIKWAIRAWDKPAFTPAMIAARSSTPSIRRHPMISLQTASPLHENCLHLMTLPTFWRSVLSDKPKKTLTRASSCLNAPFGARCFLTMGQLAGVSSGLPSLNAPFGAWFFLTVELNVLVESTDPS